MLYGSQGHRCSPVAVDDDRSGARHDKVGSLLWVCDRLVGEGLRAVLILPGQQQILHPQLGTVLAILPPGGVAQLGALLISLLSLRSCVFTGGSSEGAMLCQDPGMLFYVEPLIQRFCVILIFLILSSLCRQYLAAFPSLSASTTTRTPVNQSGTMHPEKLNMWV